LRHHVLALGGGDELQAGGGTPTSNF